MEEGNGKGQVGSAGIEVTCEGVKPMTKWINGNTDK